MSDSINHSLKSTDITLQYIIQHYKNSPYDFSFYKFKYAKKQLITNNVYSI